MTTLVAGSPLQITVSGARGESFADVARRVGSIDGTPVPSNASDALVLSLTYQGLTELVAAAGYTVIEPVAVATTANITLSGEQTIDGYLTSTSRVLVKNQSSGADDGIYVTAAGAWARATDFDQTAEVVQGSFVLVQNGDSQRGSWVLVTADPITVGSTAQVWRPFAIRDITRADLIDPAGAGLIGYDDGETYGAGTLGKAIVDSGLTSFSHATSYAAGTLAKKAQQIVCVDDAPYNAVGDGVTDDAAAIQAAIDDVGANGAIFLDPRRTYAIGTTLTYTGASANAITFFSDAKPGRGPSGAMLKWIGAAGGDMVNLIGANGRFENIAFSGNATAKRGIFADSPASSGLLFSDLVFEGFVGANSAGVQLGASTTQVSEVSFVRCHFQANPGVMTFGILTATANVKNFNLDSCSWVGMQYGFSFGSVLYGGASGVAVCKFCVGAGNTGADFYVATGGSLTIIGAEFEGSTRFIESSGAAASPGNIVVIGSQWQAGICPADDYVIHNVSQKTVLIASAFANERTGTSLPKINNTGAYTGTGVGSISSFGCFYKNAEYRAPFYSAGNWLLDPLEAPYNKRVSKVISQGDSGGTNSVPTRLQDCTGTVTTVSNGVSTYLQTAGMTNLYGGLLTRSLFKVQVPNTIWTAAALSQSVILGTLPQNTRIVSVLADTTQAYAGLAGTIDLKLGMTSGGNNLLLAADVKTAAVQQGLLDADLGTGMARATAVQGGYLVWGSNPSIYATLTSGTGNLGNGSATNLSAGSTTFYIVTENMM